MTLAFTLLLAHPASAQTRRPNIVIIVADDIGYADLGLQGSTDISTPNINRLARAGVRFTDAYAPGLPVGQFLPRPMCVAASTNWLDEQFGPVNRR